MTSVDSHTRLVDSDTDMAVRAVTARIAERCPGTGSVDHSVCWDRLAASGMTELRYPNEAGGPAAPTSTALVVVEEMARSLCRASVVAGGLIVPELLRLAGLSLESISRVCADGVGVVVDAGLVSFADCEGTRVIWDCGASREGVAVVGSHLSLVQAGDELSLADGTRRVAAASDGAAPLGGFIGSDDTERGACLARLAVTADALGAAGAIFEEAVAYAKERIQFGVPIGSFQAVQHICARAFVQLESLRSSLSYAAWALDSGELQEAVTASRVAKAYGATVTVEVVHAAIQVVGGIAITWDHPAHRHLRRTVVDRMVFGDDEFHQRLVASDVDGA
jgi:alkylation response protein AidB-like acyl-CoA dehydrogenase